MMMCGVAELFWYWDRPGEALKSHLLGRPGVCGSLPEKNPGKMKTMITEEIFREHEELYKN